MDECYDVEKSVYLAGYFNKNRDLCVTSVLSCFFGAMAEFRRGDASIGMWACEAVQYRPTMSCLVGGLR